MIYYVSDAPECYGDNATQDEASMAAQAICEGLAVMYPSIEFVVGQQSNAGLDDYQVDDILMDIDINWVDWYTKKCADNIPPLVRYDIGYSCGVTSWQMGADHESALRMELAEGGVTHPVITETWSGGGWDLSATPQGGWVVRYFKVWA